MRSTSLYSLQVFSLAAGVLFLGCSSDSGGAQGTPQAGTPGSGGAAAGGSSAGSNGGSSAGAIASGGTAAGGSVSGGSGAFGAAGSGASSATGGTSSGGNATGGNATGGNATGGNAMGGNATGGHATGGTSSGGNANGGGNASGGKAGGGGLAGAGGGATTLDCSSAALTGGAQHCSSNASGTLSGGYTWTIWSSGSGGCLTTYGKDAAFKATWTNSGDFLSRVGLQWDETKTYDAYGTIAADYSYTKTGSAGGYSFIGIYGWSNTPLVEYYIVDDWFGSGPPTGGGTLKGTLAVDGGTYNIYTHTQNNQPSIHGTQTFPQFFSVRQTARQCGHISISEHFKKWASFGMTLGKMYEAKLLIEAGGGTGSIDYKLATLTAK